MAARGPMDWSLLVAAEIVGAVAGLATLVVIGRGLGVAGFGAIEYGSAVAGVALVWVRGGVETIAHREAARRPRLIRPITEALVLVKLSLAVLAYVAIAAFAAVQSDDRRWPMLASGCVLFPAALCFDVGPRSRGALKTLASQSILRSLTALAFVAVLVSGRWGWASVALAPVAAEAVTFLGYLAADHRDQTGFPRRWRPRAARVLLSRGLVASLGRFCRVSLYAADLFVLA